MDTPAVEYMSSEFTLLAPAVEHCYACAMPKRKNPAAVALGRLGGKACAKVRNERLSPEKRSEIARKAVQARWAKRAESD